MTGGRGATLDTEVEEKEVQEVHQDEDHTSSMNTQKSEIKDLKALQLGKLKKISRWILNQKDLQTRKNKCLKL